MKRALLLFPLLIVLFFGCTRQEPVHIASKDFAENKILAQMFRALAAETGIPVKATIPYGNTFDLQEGVKDGTVDLYPEYTGTGLAMMGMPAMSNGDEAMAAVSRLFSRFDIQWLERLGFNNSYVLTMQADTAVAMGVKKISDLSAHLKTLRVGCEQEFLVRPVDGFPALVRHYGFSPKPESVVADSREQLYRMLVADETHVAVTQRTDPQIEEFGLLVLEDDLEFFPAYEGAPLVRKEVLERFPRLESQLKVLIGAVTNEDMRELNRKVELDGLEARSVALDFLVEKGLVQKKPPTLKHRKLVIGLPPEEHRSTMMAKTLDSVRRVFPNRRVEVESFTDPVRALAGGRAFMAMLGAEYFFEVRPGTLPAAREDIEAVAVVGFRDVHLIRPAGEISESPFQGVRRLGVGPGKSSSEQAARILLDAYGADDQIELVGGDLERQAEDLIRGRIDALIVLAAPGDARVLLILEDPRLALQPVSGWGREDRQYRYPFLRLARIGENVYPHLKVPLETVGAQVVLAGPRPERIQLGDGDPVSGLQIQRKPIPLGVKKELAAALGEKEAIDPSLPGEPVSLVTARRRVAPLNPAPGVSALTAAFLAAMGCFFYFLLRKTASHLKQ